MGTLRSLTDESGTVVNGVALGQPARDLDENGDPVGLYYWDDGALPTGEIVDGEVIPDDPEL